MCFTSSWIIKFNWRYFCKCTNGRNEWIISRIWAIDSQINVALIAQWSQTLHLKWFGFLTVSHSSTNASHSWSCFSRMCLYKVFFCRKDFSQLLHLWFFCSFVPMTLILKSILFLTYSVIFFPFSVTSFFALNLACLVPLTPFFEFSKNSFGTFDTFFRSGKNFWKIKKKCIFR